MIKSKKIIVSLITIVLIILAIDAAHIFWNPYWDMKYAIGKEYTARGILLSGTGKGDTTHFQLCEWDYEAISFKEAGKYPNCIGLNVNDKEISKYIDYSKKKIEIIGTVKSLKEGDSGENCELSQIGCERDIIVLVPEKIQEIK